MHVYCAAAAVAASLVTPAAVFARQQQQKLQSPIVVSAAPVSVHDWSKRITRSLDRNLKARDNITGYLGPEGVVEVRFAPDANGAPTNIAVARSSNTRELDRIAMRAVAQLKTLSPLPEGMAPNQRYAAILLFANSVDSYDHQMKTVAADVKRRNAWLGANGQETAMLVGPVPAGQ